MEALIGSSYSKIFGRDFLDAQAVTGALAPDTKFKPAELSPLELELARAKARGEFLIHRTDKTPDGQPATMHKMVQLLQGEFDSQGYGRILYNTTWYQDEAFFMEDTPRPGLALVSKGLLPNSTNRDYLQQTQVIADYITNEVFRNRQLPEVCQKAVDQWEKEKPYLKKLLRSDWRQAVEGLSGLEINWRFRETPVEGLQDLLVPFLVSGERRLLNVATWTNARSSGGYLVSLGYFAPHGADVLGWHPGFGASRVGVCFSAALTDLGL